MKRGYVFLWYTSLIFTLCTGAMNLIFLFGESFFLFHNKSVYPSGNWHPAGIHPEEIILSSKDNTLIHGWYLPYKNSHHTILYLHGNVGNVTNRYAELVTLHDTLQASVMTFDYRGFGKSTGSPVEKTMLEDAKTIRLWLAQKEKINTHDIILMGRSMGTAIAINLAAHGGAKAVILISAFTSLPAVIKYHYPLLATTLMHNRFDALANIAAYHGPLLSIHSNTDNLIPLQNGQALFAAANSPKLFFVISNYTHFDPIPIEAYQAMRHFIRTILPPHLDTMAISNDQNINNRV